MIQIKWRLLKPKSTNFKTDRNYLGGSNVSPLKPFYFMIKNIDDALKAALRSFGDAKYGTSVVVMHLKVKFTIQNI